MIVLQSLPVAIQITILDRTIFEHIRLRLVSDGRTPDIVVHNTKQLFDAALQEIKDNDISPFLIFGTTIFEEKDEITCDSAFVNRDSSTVSKASGSTHEYIYIENEGVYTKYKIPSQKRDVTYTIRVIYDRQENERYFTELIYSIFGKPSGLGILEVDGDDYVISETKSLFVNLGQDVDISTPDLGAREYVIVLPEVLIGEIVEIPEENVVGIEEITLNLHLENSEVAVEIELS